MNYKSNYNSSPGHVTQKFSAISKVKANTFFTDTLPYSMIVERRKDGKIVS